MNEPGAHPRGFYGKYPDVTWDLAQERWLSSRSITLAAQCLSCGGWNADDWVLARPERVWVAERLLEGQHWYQCPSSKSPRIRILKM